MAKFSEYLKNIFFIVILLQIAPPIFQSIKKQYSDLLEPKTKVATITIKGVVLDSSYYTKYLKTFFKNSDIKAILLKIESPGAAAGSAEAVANEIEILKKEYPKPIITLCENICTSGSYYIAVTTDTIIAPPSALIGSIGTKIPYQFKLNNFMEQFKISYIPIKSGEYKDATDPFVAITPEQIAHLQSVTDDSYQNFIEHVAKNRSAVTLNTADQWANGKLFTARQAKIIGLIDQIGSRSNAVNEIKKRAMIEGKIEWIAPKEASGFFELLTGRTSQPEEGLSASIMETVLKTFLTLVQRMLAA